MLFSFKRSIISFSISFFFLESTYALGLQFKFINDLIKLIVEELLVKITGSLSGITPYLQIYFSKE